jgi:TonB family protein
LFYERKRGWREAGPVFLFITLCTIVGYTYLGYQSSTQVKTSISAVLTLFVLSSAYSFSAAQPKQKISILEGDIQTVRPGEAICPVSKGKLIKGNVHTAVDELPEFPGGQKKLMSYINTNLKHPPGANDIVTRVIITFVVNPDGSLSDLEIAGRRQNPLFEKEALRVVQKSPKWIPGKIKGKAVRTQYTVPILFQQP